jgi:hypothetical protein
MLGGRDTSGVAAGAKFHGVLFPMARACVDVCTLAASAAAFFSFPIEPPYRKLITV